MAQLWAGTSGFAYPQWKPDFYPAKIAAKQFLEHYATQLNSVEINYTFRRLVAGTTLENWVRSTPPDFRFSMKAHMRITHLLRLKNAGEFTEVFLKSVDPLRATRRLGPLLFQLPPNLKCDTGLLSDYLALLPGDLRYAFEFRNTTWMNDAVYSILASRGMSLCLAESDKFETPPVVTAGFVYARLRKAEYSEDDRREIADRVRAHTTEGRDVFVYFKHEETPAGALYAKELIAEVSA